MMFYARRQGGANAQGVTCGRGDFPLGARDAANCYAMRARISDSTKSVFRRAWIRGRAGRALTALHLYQSGAARKFRTIQNSVRSHSETLRVTSAFGSVMSVSMRKVRNAISV